ncbi:MAG: hypothetical protein KDI48_03650 [Xanthomonadales bacterium]|nr:hypothetical protein [Xanthomonadales bacterium]
MRATLMIALALSLAACSAVSTDPQQWLTPTEAIHAINASPDKAARGHFSFVVQGMGERGDWTFLNSEADYRHPDCLTIRLRTAMVPALEQRLGVSLSALQGRRIAVMGQARRVRIYLTDGEGQRSTRYYHQYQLLAENTTQITLVE